MRPLFFGLPGRCGFTKFWKFRKPGEGGNAKCKGGRPLFRLPSSLPSFGSPAQRSVGIAISVASRQRRNPPACRAGIWKSITAVEIYFIHFSRRQSGMGLHKRCGSEYGSACPPLAKKKGLEMQNVKGVMQR